MTNKLIESIQENEGFSGVPYIDPLYIKTIPKDELQIIEKHWDNLNITIGYGRCLQTNPLSTYESFILLDSNITALKVELSNKISFFKGLPDYVQIILLEMAYQLGVNGLLKFKQTLEHINNKDYKKASVEMLISKWAIQTPNRARELSNLMKGGN